MAETISNNKRIAKNTLFMYGRMLIMTLISLYTSRIVFNALGVNDFGIYNVVGGIIVFFTFINGGLSRATARYITAEITEGTAISQRNVFNLSVVAHFIIAFIILFLCETIGLYLINVYLNIPSGRMFAANVVYQFSVIAAIFSVMQTPFTAAIVAFERMSIYAYFTVLDAIFKLVTAFILIKFTGDRLILYAFLIFSIGIINIVIYRIYCYRKFAMCKWERPRNKKLLKELFGFMGWSLTGQAAVVATNQGVNFLINIFYNVAVNAAIGLSNTIVGTINNFIINFQIAFNPQIIKLYVAKEYEELMLLSMRCTRLTSFLILIFMVPVSFQIKNILTLWLGHYPLYAPEFCILTLIAIYLDNVSGAMWMIRGADKNIKIYQIVVSIVYSLCFWGGWIALAFGLVPYCVIWIRIFVFFILFFVRAFFVKSLIPQLSISRYFFEVFLRTPIILIIPLIVMFFIKDINFGNLFLNLILNCLIGFFLISIAIFVLGLNRWERNLIIEKVKRAL
ncbi:hypothetical protein [Hoylesella oralis]|uniref:hypothetical protein n=1 Tax=Hoylesella oralis TaxID=28134 RepID=UPI0028E9BA98|nr:hypothetical protein [Hoylesella oralis]